MQETNKFKLTYGNIVTKKVKALLKNKRSINSITFFKFFESRLDVVLFRAKFGLNVRHVGQLIHSGKIFVNNKLVKIKSYVLQSGDIVTIQSDYFKLIKFHALKLNWPICPKHLIVNYCTSQIIFYSLGSDVSLNLFYHINFENILAGYYQN